MVRAQRPFRRVLAALLLSVVSVSSLVSLTLLSSLPAPALATDAAALNPDVPLTAEDMAHLNAVMSDQTEGFSGLAGEFNMDTYTPAMPEREADDEALRYVDTFLHSQMTLQFDIGDNLDYSALPVAGAVPADAAEAAAAAGDGMLYKSFTEHVGQQPFRAHFVILQRPHALTVFPPSGQSPAQPLTVAAESHRCKLALSLGLVNLQSHSITGTLVANGTALHRSRTDKGRRRVALGIDAERKHVAVGYPEDSDLFPTLVPSPANNHNTANNANNNANGGAHYPMASPSTPAPLSPALGPTGLPPAGTPVAFSEMVTGAGWLVRKGQSFLETAVPIEGLDEEDVARRGPRAALGVDEKGHIMVIVVEGSRVRLERNDTL